MNSELSEGALRRATSHDGPLTNASSAASVPPVQDASVRITSRATASSVLASRPSGRPRPRTPDFAHVGNRVTAWGRDGRRAGSTRACRNRVKRTIHRVAGSLTTTATLPIRQRPRGISHGQPSIAGMLATNERSARVEPYSIDDGSTARQAGMKRPLSKPCFQTTSPVQVT
jgi:hypothetical protein